MNENHRTPTPAPTAECATFAPHLALIGSDSLDPNSAAETRAHLETCAWCRAKLANFASVDAALVRHFGSAQPMRPRLSLEQIMTSDDDDEPTQIDEWVPPASRSSRRGPGSAILAIACTIALVVVASVIFSTLPHGPGASTGPAPTVTTQPRVSPTIAPTATPLSACGLLTGAGAPFQSLSFVPGLVLPSGAYISTDSTSGGGNGKYAVHSYTVCYPGNEAAVDGGVLGQGGTPTSSLGLLEQSGWTAGELFPGETDYVLPGYCSGSRFCLNDSGTPHPFTFLAVDQFFMRAGNLTTFRLQVATIATPTCLNNPTYYSGTPHYTLYEEGNAPTDATYYFFMPPATRVSSFTDSGAGGSHVVYFCSAGTSASILNLLESTMQPNDWSITETSASTFTARKGNNPAYRIDVNTANPGNYSLRIYYPA